MNQTPKGMSVSTDLLRLLLGGAPLPNGELLGLLEGYAEKLLGRIRPEQTWSARVAEVLGRTLMDGKPRVAQAARLLGVSRRGLQGKLKEEGTTYQAVLDQVRHQLAVAYLKEDAVTLAEAAFLLGFSDQSAFTHAFRKWTGDSPHRFRAAGIPAAYPL